MEFLRKLVVKLQTLKAIQSLVTMMVIAGLACKKTPNEVIVTPDTLPTIGIDDLSKAEGNGGTATMDFSITLSKAFTKEVSVRAATKDLFGKAGEDFTALDQKIVFAPGETKKTISVQIVADDLREGTDDFQITLSEAVNCTVISNGTGFIENDDTKIPVTTVGYNTTGSYAGKTLVWSDEFDGSALKTSNWNYDVGDGCPNCGWGNNELEYYTAGDNATVTNGNLIIEARKESKNGKNYTSTRLQSLGKQSFKFGRIDIRAKMPKGQGIWPALWMLGDNFPTAGWPACGEMDILELLGHEPSKMYSTIHFKRGTGSVNISSNLTHTASLSEEYHVYSLDWSTDKMRFLFDDKLVREFTVADLGGATYPFNEKFFFIINLAVGGNWPGSPNATTYFPQWLFVDYVRVYQ